MYLAYQYVAVTLMLAEVNFIGPRLDLPVHFPLHRDDLMQVSVAPPDLNWASGNVGVQNMVFAFSHDGRLCFIENTGALRVWNTLGVRKRNEMLLQQKSLIDTNDAYRMATNVLQRMYVNVAALEKEMPLKVEQRYRWKDHVINGTKEFLPIFDIRWGVNPRFTDHKSDRLHIVIDGVKKEFVEIRLEDDSLSQRPPGLIKSRGDLLKISDEEFLKYSDQQRKDLAAKFAVIAYDSAKEKTNEPPARASSIPTDTETNAVPSGGNHDSKPSARTSAPMQGAKVLRDDESNLSQRNEQKHCADEFANGGGDCRRAGLSAGGVRLRYL
jgi:hypothetical protein